ncbi:MAG: hypothetical protein KAU95_03785 [Candidatus Aenigmarchaeota archaeon]|nr:hypothetical protein [Candidatus Aenigmarchaeota archaeon]
MRKAIFIIFSLILIIFTSGCIQEKESGLENSVVNKELEESNSEEDKFFDKDGTKYLNYTIEEKIYTTHAYPHLLPSMEWIRETTPESSVFLNWWDYGHLIIGYAERGTIIYSPSEDILWSLASGRWNTEGGGEFSTREQIDDVALALSTIDPKVAKTIMKKYNANYLFVTRQESETSYVIFTIAGLDVSEYVEDYQPKEKAFETILFKAINREEISGFELVYEDESAIIYHIVE